MYNLRHTDSLFGNAAPAKHTDSNFQGLPLTSMTAQRLSAETATVTLGHNVQQLTTSAPLVQLIPYLKAAFTGLQYISALSVSLFRPLALLSPIPVLLYVFAPVIVFTDIVATIFIRSPYRIVTYLIDALFPLYVFCGVACITGGLIGLAARVLCRIFVACAENKDEEDGKHDESKKIGVKGKSRTVGKVEVTSR